MDLARYLKIVVAQMGPDQEGASRDENRRAHARPACRCR